MRGAKPRSRGSQRRRSARAAAAVASGKGKRFASHPSTHGTRRNRRPSSRTWQHLASCGIEPPTSRMQNRRCTWNSARGEGTYRTSWWMPTGQTTWCWWSGGRTGSKPSGTFGEEGRKSAPPGTGRGRHPRRHPRGRTSSASAWTSRTFACPASPPSTAATPSSRGNTSAAPRLTSRSDAAWTIRTVVMETNRRRHRPRAASPASRWPRAATTGASGAPTSTSRLCENWALLGTIFRGWRGCRRGRATAPRRASAASSALGHPRGRI